jgi:hypothetical protein
LFGSLIFTAAAWPTKVAGPTIMAAFDSPSFRYLRC